MRAVTAPDFGTLRVRLAEEVAEHRRRGPLEAVRVVTPSERARVEIRLDLAERTGGTLGVEVLSWPGWIEGLVRADPAAPGARPLPETAFEPIVGRQLEDAAAEPTAARDPLLRLAGAPGLSSALTATFQDLMEGGFLATDLTADRDESDPVRRSLFAAYGRFLEYLDAENLRDRRRREQRAADVVGDDPRLTLFFGFHDFTALQRRVVAAADAAMPVVLFVPGPAGPRETEPGETAAAALLQWASGLGASIDVGERRVQPSLQLRDGMFRAATLSDPGPDAVQLFTHATEAAEVRAIARRIRRETDAGRRFDEIVVTIPATGPSALSFRRVFRRAGIPLEDRAGVPLARLDAGRRALALARGLAPGDRARAGLDFMAPPTNGKDLEDLQREERVFHAAPDVEAALDAFRALHHHRFGEAPSDAVQKVLDAIGLAHCDRPLPAPTLAAALGSALSRERIRETHPEGAASAVLLLTTAAARFVSRPVAFHAGCIEGSIRRPPPADPLLPDSARRALNERHEHAGRFLPVHEDRREEQLLLARFTFETGTELTVLSWSERARIGSEVRNPSGLFLDLAARRAGRALQPGTPPFAAVAPSPDPADARLHPADPTDRDLALFTTERRPSETDLAALLDEERARHLLAALEAAEHRWRDPQLGRWDGVLQGDRALERIEALLHDRAWSATALETLANCPFSYLMRLLRLDENRAPEDDYDPMERGKLFHELMEKIYGRLLADQQLPLTPELLPRALEALDVLVGIEGRVVDRLGERRSMQRRATLQSLRDDVAILLARDAHSPPDERTTPVRVEMGFGFDEDDDNPAPTLALDGESIRLRGRIDRVDRRPDGALEVVDLKTGKRRAKSHRLRSEGDGKPEIRLQLPLYLEAAGAVLGLRPERAYLWHALTSHDFEKVEFTAQDLERERPAIRALISHLLERARAGWFPCTPGKSCCWRHLEGACGPGVTARFHRKRTDEHLVEHLETVRGTETNGDSR